MSRADIRVTHHTAMGLYRSTGSESMKKRQHQEKTERRKFRKRSHDNSPPSIEYWITTDLEHSSNFGNI
jgi:hypothetical protein